MPGRARPAHARLLLLTLTFALATGCSDSLRLEAEPAGGPAPTKSSEPASGGTPPSPDDAPVTTVPEQQGDGDVLSVEPVVTGLHTPWDVDFFEDGSALITLRDSGEVLRLRGEETIQLDAGGPGGSVPEVHHEKEDGLLGASIGPDQEVYLYMTTASDNRVVRYDLEGESLSSPKVILEGIPAHSNHDGGRMAFGPDGYLYITTGDAGDLDLPQDTDSLAGKILRVTTTGEPAPGNPFGNEVWSYGHRNVQGIGWTSDGRMYASEFGSDQFDELNLIEPGGNYGWPLIEGWAGDPAYIDPLVTWSTDEASPSGIAVTDHGVWMTALRGERLWHVPLSPTGEVGEPSEHHLNLGRLRHVTTAPDGSLWLVTSNTDGRGDPGPQDDQIVRLEIA